MAAEWPEALLDQTHWWRNCVLWRRRLALVLLVLLMAALPPPPAAQECDRLWVSGGSSGSPRNGSFSSPVLLNPEGHSAQCVYTFVAVPGERVELVFSLFNLRGSQPECYREYLDIYSEAQDGAHSPGELIHSPWGGRFCGRIPPRRRISLYRTLAIAFYTDFNITSDDLFAGSFAFIPDERYSVGTPVPSSPCSFTVLSLSKKTGEVLSPTYPGVYPKAMSCEYLFLGAPDQRVRLEFRDFDLFYGGAHCPFDLVKVYDGADKDSAVIGTYCGQQRNLVLFSSHSDLLVTFTTLPRTTPAQNRGFSAIYEFSESFVKLDFIGKNAGEHIRGTECDQKILSKKESSGSMYSPNYPYPYIPKIVCRYFVYGLQDNQQNLERVRMRFDKFDVPSGPGDCSDAFIKLFVKGQEQYDKPDYEFCGQEVPPSLVSDGPSLVLVFSSGETQGLGFKANYTFETEYRIPGTAAPDGSCHFTYLSSSRKKGDLNSPRFPSNYPSDTNCTYVFVANPNEQVRLVFDNFKIRDDQANTTYGAYGSLCQEDWLDIWNVYRDGSERPLGRYCGTTAPGPVESNRGAAGIRVLLHTNSESVYSGFKARYAFVTAQSVFGECGRNVSGAPSGVLTSPSWPEKYEGPLKGDGASTCHWFISVRPRHRVLLTFESFAIEGDPANRGCPAAVLRVWVNPDGPPLELCGEYLPTERAQYLSASSLMRVTFVTAEKAVGAEGFRAVWTEVREGTGCDAFECTRSGFCIDEQLRCDRTPNCGLADRSDEANCGGDSDLNTFLLLGLALGLVAVLLLGAAVWCQRQRRRRRQRRPALHLPPPRLRAPPICDHTAVPRFATVDSV